MDTYKYRGIHDFTRDAWEYKGYVRIQGHKGKYREIHWRTWDARVHAK